MPPGDTHAEFYHHVDPVVSHTYNRVELCTRPLGYVYKKVRTSWDLALFVVKWIREAQEAPHALLVIRI